MRLGTSHTPDAKPDKGMRQFDFGRLPGRPWVRWTLVFTAWTLFGVVMAGEAYFRARLRGEAPGLVPTLAPIFTWCYYWALFTPVILWLTCRYPFDRQRWPRSLAVHLLASLAIAWIGALAYNSVNQLVGDIPPGFSALLSASLQMFVIFLHFDPLLYWIIVGLSYLIQHYQESRERQMRALQLEAQLTEARLQALEAQLHPHFLFNALNTIAVLVRTERNAQAVRVVTGLGELLRRALDSAGTQVVPLKQEIEFVRRYLEIEQIRFGDRLRVEIDIEPGIQEARVPYPILQPLVENAIQHAIAPLSSGGSLRVSGRRDDDRLRLAVHDDGPGLSEPIEAPARNGVGLSTTHERLQQLYGDDHDFVVANADGGGVTAALEIPFQLTPDEWREA